MTNHGPKGPWFFFGSARKGSHHGMNTKEQVRRLIERLPDDCSVDDVMEALYVLWKVHRGFASIDDDGGFPMRRSNDASAC